MGNVLAMQEKIDILRSSGSEGSSGFTKTVMESRAVSGMLVFDEKGTVSFKEWSGKLASILDQLHPGNRQAVWETVVSREEEWAPAVHQHMFGA